MLDENLIVRVKRGLYKLNDLEVENELFEAAQIAPNGVLCLFSAWSYYDLTTYAPFEHHIAIRKGEKVTLPSYPPIQLYYWTEKSVVLGLQKESNIKIHDIERSVCDVVRFRHKVGLDICKEVLKNYLKRPSRNIQQLLFYARKLRIGNLMREYVTLLT